METLGVMPNTNLDGTPFDFSNWREGEPNTGSGKYYARLYVRDNEDKYGTWVSVKDNKDDYLPVCMMNAISGPVQGYINIYQLFSSI